MVIAMGVAWALSTLESGPLKVLVYDESAPNAATTALALGLGGVAVHLITNDPLDVLATTACSSRLRSGTSLVLIITAAEFVAAWSLICVAWYSDTAISVGIRNFALGLATAAVFRTLSGGQAYLAAPLGWLFPAILPGAGALGHILGVALHPPSPTVDAWIAAPLTMLAAMLLISLQDVRSRRRG